MLGTSIYYIVGIALFLAFAALLVGTLVRRSRRRPDHRTLYIQALQALLDGDQVVAFYKLKEVVSQDSDNVDAYIRLGKILSERGNNTSAIQVHSELLLRLSLTAEQLRSIRFALADDYIRDRQVNKAVELLKKEYERSPRDHHVGAKLLDLLIREQKWQEAEEIAERAYKHAPEAFKSKYADIKIKLADQLQTEGRSKKARVIYKDAYKIDDSKAAAWVKVGESYLAERRVDDAVKAWRTLTELDPGSSYLVIDRIASSLFELGQFNALGGILENILERDPDNREAGIALAELYVKKGDFERAEEYYRRILDIDPDHLAAAVGLAKAYREQGRTNDALNSLEKLYSSRRMAARES